MYDLTGARIYWEAAAAKVFEVQVSLNGSTWTRAYYSSNGDGGTDNLSFTESARYVRVYCTSRLTEYGVSIREFEIFGSLKTGVEDIRDDGSISISPNPSGGGMVTVTFNGAQPGEDLRFTTTIITGEQAASEVIRVPGNGKLELMLPGGAGLTPGIYIVTVTGEKYTQHTRLMIR